MNDSNILNGFVNILIIAIRILFESEKNAIPVPVL